MLSLGDTIGYVRGYSAHPQGPNNGQLVSVRVRVAAINSEGQGDWSDWFTQTLATPFSGTDGDAWTTSNCGSECYWISAEMYGLAANTQYDVTSDVVTAGGINPGDPGCDAGLHTTDADGILTFSFRCRVTLSFLIGRPMGVWVALHDDFYAPFPVFQFIGQADW